MATYSTVSEDRLFHCIATLKCEFETCSFVRGGQPDCWCCENLQWYAINL